MALRELGTFERLRVTMHDLGFHYNVAIVARYSRDAARLNRKLIFFALRKAIQQHPALCAVVSSGKNNHDGKPCFVRLAEIDLNKVVSFVEKPTTSSEDEEQKYLDRVLSEQNSLGFNTDGLLPLWRIVVLQHELSPVTDLMFVWHHVIADGLSGLVFHSTVLEALNSAPQTVGEEDDEFAIVPTSTKPLLPPLENYVSFSVSPMTRISNAFKRWLASWFTAKGETKRWTGSPYNRKSLPTKTLIRQISIPAATVSGLVSRCRSERTSITALLQALVGKVLAETFKDAYQLRCATAISIRRFIPIRHGADNAMGLWATGSRQNYACHALLNVGGRNTEGGFPWGVARKNKQRIRREIARSDRDATVGSLRNIADFETFLMEKMGKRRDDSYSITNIGVFDNEAPVSRSAAAATRGNHQWRISRVAFSQSCHVSGSAVQFCIVSTKGGEMIIALNWQEGVVPVGDVDQVVRGLREQLLQLGGGSDLGSG